MSPDPRGRDHRVSHPGPATGRLLLERGADVIITGRIPRVISEERDFLGAVLEGGFSGARSASISLFCDVHEWFRAV